MNIQFPNEHSVDQDTFDISFPADVDGNQIRCSVTREALQDQDINPSRATDSAETQFKTNRYQLQQIAEGKIREGEVQNGKVAITSADVR